jgi:adenosine kinase
MILVSGSLAFDQIMDFPGSFSEHIDPTKLHMLNVSFLVHKMRKGFGGTAGNIAYSLALLGCPCAIIGVVGQDFSPYRTFLENVGVDMSLLRESKTAYTSSAFGIVDNKDNNIWGFYPGADEESDALSVSTLPKTMSYAIIAPNNPKTMLKFAGEYGKKHIPYLFDPGMQLPWLSGAELCEAFKGATGIIGNDYEIGIIEKKTDIGDLHMKFPDKIVITTLGERGSRVSYQGKTHDIPTAKVDKAIDPAGSGDAYRSGFVTGLMHHLPIPVCGRMGSVAAAYTVEKYGTTTHTYTIKEFCTRFRDNFSETLSLT